MRLTDVRFESLMLINIINNITQLYKAWEEPDTRGRMVSM
jgi:hypothetical protein